MRPHDAVWANATKTEAQLSRQERRNLKRLRAETPARLAAAAVGVSAERVPSAWWRTIGPACDSDQRREDLATEASEDLALNLDSAASGASGAYVVPRHVEGLLDLEAVARSGPTPVECANRCVQPIASLLDWASDDAERYFKETLPSIILEYVPVATEAGNKENYRRLVAALIRWVSICYPGPFYNLRSAIL